MQGMHQNWVSPGAQNMLVEQVHARGGVTEVCACGYPASEHSAGMLPPGFRSTYVLSGGPCANT